MASTSNISDTSELAVIAVLFNPLNYQTRYQLYQQFAKHMAQSGVFLYTVECIFESTSNFGLPQQSFQICQRNDASHLQVRAPSILWMKENLINIAVHELPSRFKYIAWIDADVEFDVRAIPESIIPSSVF
jgi:hypothetical protein